ncbi:hypothetical protein [Photorhabdus bodei]|uniref:Uncharacterized protein n=1 Tax=Photorhabdus bodei TaxID=2029681 RepID=A0AAW6BFY1_9GAMM|nr:hypothetical protein [Photorhabdus bodei]MDB6370740.1 hypothetical protein [Photorhabdus bodei]
MTGVSECSQQRGSLKDNGYRLNRNSICIYYDHNDNLYFVSPVNYVNFIWLAAIFILGKELLSRISESSHQMVFLMNFVCFCLTPISKK